MRSTGKPPTSFSFHISRAVSGGGGGARIDADADVVEIDPCGAVRIKKESREIRIPSEQTYVSRWSCSDPFNSFEASSVEEKTQINLIYSNH